MFLSYVLFAIIVLMGLITLYIGGLELYKRFVWKRMMSSIGLGITFILIGSIFVVVGIWAGIETANAEARKIDFAQQCEDKGGTVLEPEDASGWQCWQNRIEIEGY